MQTTSEILINPLVDNSLIPIDISRFIYNMPILDIERLSIFPGEPVCEQKDVSIMTTDDIRYEMIMSFVYSNALIGF